MITDKDIIDYCFNNDRFNFHALKRIINKKLDYYNYILNRYDDSESLKETIYRIKYNIKFRPVCPVCGKPVKFLGRMIYNKCFSTHCSPKCSSLDKNVKEKLKQTCLERYGVEHVSQSIIVKEKTKQTCLERYGVEHYTNREKSKETYNSKSNNEKQEIVNKIKQTKKDKYNNENYNNPEKTKQTCLERYGVDNIFKSEQVKEKAKQTCLKRYGITNGGGSAKAIQKIKQTKLERYGDEKYNNYSQIKQTNLERYGYTTALLNENIKNKSVNTMLTKYGVKYSMLSDEIKSKYNWDKIVEKRIETMRKNDTFIKSQPEDDLYIILKEHYPDVIRQYKEKRYPFNCDFYIPSKDLFIEYQGSQYHQNHPFNENDENDIKILEELKERANKSNRHEEGKKSQYDVMIYVWTDLDIRKRTIAKENNLNYIELWNAKDIQQILY